MVTLIAGNGSPALLPHHLKKVGNAVEARVERYLREWFPEGPGGVDPQCRS